eukprot:TRINITY_DN3685_c0_g1_i5.p1 TRINITY_DN3685_c0_g1~~TRINITY_DN3685_c0_g1_i5.p1  ORF type:complete len:136 (+),score=35.58 TRINITY_DN3685_c0_g1_i5:336-743(+)
MGATNRPQELDEAARRRMVKRIYIPLPDPQTRFQIIENLLNKENHSLSVAQITRLAKDAEGYSASDLTALCRDAALGAIRELSKRGNLQDISKSQVREISLQDFKDSMTQIRPSVRQDSLRMYDEWNKSFGSRSL